MNQQPQVVLYTPLSTNATIVIVASFLIVGFIVWLICRHKHNMKKLDKTSTTVVQYPITQWGQQTIETKEETKVDTTKYQPKS